MKMPKGIKGKAAISASVAALVVAMAPAAAFAEAGSHYTSDITVNGVDSGATVTAYEIVDAKVDASNNLSYDFAAGIDANAYKALQSNSDEMKAMVGTIATGIADGSVNPIEVKTATAAGGPVVFSGLDDGEWLIVVTNANGSTKVYQNTVVNNTPKVNGLNYQANPQTVTVKSDNGPKPDKTVGNETDHETHAYQIGDAVPFTITTAIPNYPSNYANPTFVVNDAPSAGLVDDVNSVAVQANGVDVAKDPANYSVAVASTNGFKLTFTEAFIKTHLGQSITVKYNAKLTSAAFKTNDGVTANSVTVDFSNSPNTTSTSDPVEDKVHTYGFFFQKVSADSNALTGAEFTLYNADGTEVTDENGAPLKSTSDNSGYVWFEDLADGKTYTLKETKVPAGKQAVPDFTVTISKDAATLDNPATPGVTEANYQKYSVANTIVDPDQPALPVTGGPGTLALTAAGVILIAGGAVVVLRSRKHEN